MASGKDSKDWREQLVYMYPHLKDRTIVGEEDNKYISFNKLIWKQFITLILGIIICIYLVQAYLDDTHRPIFEQNLCDPSSNSSIITLQQLSSTFGNDGRGFCIFKLSMAWLSVLLLIPFIRESIQMSYYYFYAVLWPKTHRNVPIYEGKVIDKEELDDGRRTCGDVPRGWFVEMLGMFVLLPLIFFLMIICFPCTCLVCLINRKNLPIDFLTAAPLAYLMIAPELLLAAELPLASYYVVLNSGSPEDVLVNIVAVQIFSQLDDILVTMMLNRKKSIGESLLNVMTDSPESKAPVFIENLNDVLAMRREVPSTRPMLNEFKSFSSRLINQGRDKSFLNESSPVKQTRELSVYENEDGES